MALTLDDPRLADPEVLALAGVRARLRKQQQSTEAPPWHADVRARLRLPHAEQARFIASPAKRKIIRAGRRGGKTVGIALIAVEAFLAGRRILYAVPTQEQVDRFWFEVKRALEPAIDAGILFKNETRHTIELPRTETRIRAKTAYNADTLRGDYADLLLLDEYQLMSEDAWGLVGAPMLLDNNGDAIFVYTPPSIQSASMSKARDKQHAAKLYKAASTDTSGRWATFHFASHANPHLSSEALDTITQDMSALAHRQEILAEDTEDVPGALWTHVLLDRTRVRDIDVPEMARLAVALDPSATSTETADEMGIVAGGRGVDGHGYVLRDATMRGTPAACARRAIEVYDLMQADVMIAEVNNGGEWIGTVIQFVANEMYRQGERQTNRVHYVQVHASRGKQTRAEPISVDYEQNRIHHVGVFPDLEDQQCTWIPGMRSPDRLDACLVAGTLITTARGRIPIEHVTTADHVLTRVGWRRVLAAGMTSPSALTVTVRFSNGTSLQGTGNHPVFVVGKGFCALDSLVWHDRIMTCNDLNLLNLMESSTSDILTHHDDIPASTIMPYAGVEVGSIIETSGRPSMALFPQEPLSITKTTIPLTMTLRTLSALRGKSMPKRIQRLQGNRRSISPLFDPWQPLGISPQQVTPGIRSMGKRRGRIESLSMIPVTNAEQSTRPIRWGDPVPISVAAHVIGQPKPAHISTNSMCHAPSVARFSGSVSPNCIPRPAPVSVVAFSPGETAAVYNLTVADQPEYFANGILVHNCVWLFTELLLQQKAKSGTMALRF